ncbi:MAG TPA: hypothetical protein VJ283_19075, partial [Trebonia sp.]|nr:hypothetical protein [Trebonia sp.]
NAQLLRGEVLARWQDYADSGELGAALRGKRGAHGGRRARKGTGVPRPAALDTALRAALQALVVSVADRAAEQVTRTWRADPAATALLAAAEATTSRGEFAQREFESAFGADAPGASDEAARPPSLDRSSPDLPLRVTRAVSAWQDHLMRLVQGETTSHRASTTSRASERMGPLSLVTLVAMLGEPAIATGQQSAQARPGGPGGPGGTGADEPGEIATVPRELLVSAFGTVAASELTGQVRRDLTDRVRLLLDEELLRFLEVLDSAGQVDPVAAVRLYQAEYSVEAVR